MSADSFEGLITAPPSGREHDVIAWHVTNAGGQHLDRNHGSNSEVFPRPDEARHIEGAATTISTVRFHNCGERMLYAVPPTDEDGIPDPEARPALVCAKCDGMANWPRMNLRAT